MKLKTLDRAGLRHVYKTHVVQDFPPAERKPLMAMEHLVRTGKYDPLGCYRGDVLVAYAFLWHDERTDYVLLDYLAVCTGGRGEGVGTQVLRLLGEHYSPYLGILAEAEAVSAAATSEENVLRLRRQEFYIRAGFRRLDYQAKLFTVVYEMLSSGEADCQSAIAAQRRLYCGAKYQPGKFVEIPYEKS